MDFGKALITPTLLQKTQLRGEKVKLIALHTLTQCTGSGIDKNPHRGMNRPRISIQMQLEIMQCSINVATPESSSQFFEVDTSASADTEMECVLIIHK